MKNLEDFRKELEVIQLEDRLEIVAVEPIEVETGCVGVCCCVE